MKRIIALVLVIAIASVAVAQTRLYGGRYSPPGTFMGDRETLKRIAARHPLGKQILADYNKTFGPGWEDCLVPKGTTAIPEGARVSNKRVIGVNGKLGHATTYQHRSDGKPDPAFYMENPKTGQGSWVKSCGQPFSMAPPPPDQPIVIETDLDHEINFDLDIKIQVEATSTSQATANGGSVQFYAPPAQFAPPLRWIASVSRDTFEVGSITWQPQVKINNNNWQSQNQQQQQLQQQMQQQMQQQQQQMQQMQQQLQELLNHLNGGGSLLAYMAPDSSGTIHLAPFPDRSRAAIAA